LLAALIAKVVTNFITGEPGMGGIRVSAIKFLEFILAVTWDDPFLLH
jgi:hypothetical protein